MPVFSIPLSGLTASSIALSTIANNLANLNTVGYKETRVLFRDLFYQTLGSNGAGDPLQQGAGTAISAMPSMFTQGNIDPSGVATDVAITGEGLFVTQKDGVVSYTRAGNFEVDKSAQLVTAEGAQVMGYPAVNGAISRGQGLAPLVLGTGTISPAVATGNVQVRTNLNAAASVGDSYSTPLTVYDSLGASHVLKFTFTKAAANQWGYAITIPAADVGGTGAATSIGSGTLSFDGSGNLTSPVADVAGIAVSGLADGASSMSFNWKLYDGSSGLLTQVAAPSSTVSSLQDGSGSGALVSFAIGADGTITGTFSNDKTAVLGQLALAKFGNVEGLLRSGRNSFIATLASGDAVIGAAGTGGRGSLSGGALELSNVDIAKEFAALIVAQRGFQANARVVTTFDEITQDTINLKR